MPFRKADYGPEWDRIKKRILEREGYRCRMCGVKRYSVGVRHKDGRFTLHIEAASYEEARRYARDGGGLIVVKLAVAHLNHDLSNHEQFLTALCDYHHLKHDQPQHTENAKKTREAKKQELQKGLWEESDAVLI